MTQTIPLGSDARERFVLEIAAVLAPERIVEAHFFAPLRQGAIETGVCVLGALPEGAEPLPAEAPAPELPTSELPAAEPHPDSEISAISDQGESPYSDDQAPPADSGVTADEASEQEGDHGLSEIAEPYPAGARISSRHVVYSARYRWTRKGIERGKWECEVVAEADAPLLTVEAVVQGVQHRSAEPLEVQKLDGDTVRAMIAQARQQWPKTA